MASLDGDRGLSRRHFLAAAGLTGGVLAVNQANLFAQEAAASAPASQSAGFAKIPFGKTGLKVTLVGYGAIKIGPPTGSRLLKMAIDAGVNVVHTARGYSGGKSIQAIGQLLEQEPAYRKKIVLCVKENAKVSEEALDKDLANLHTDHADVYLPQLQDPNQAMMEDAIAALEDLKKKGKIRFGGFTCHSKINEVCELVLEKAPKGYDCCLISTAPLRPEGGKVAEDEQAQRFAKNLKNLSKAGVGIISMKSGASGVVGKGAADYGSHMRVLAAAGVDTCITSFASVKEIENAMAAGLDKLGPATTADVARWERQWQAASWPCMMCGQCTGACPAGLPVASLMRMSLYRDHYRMTRHAKQEFADLGVSTAALGRCDGCTSCSGVCPVGLASAGKVHQIVSRLA